MLKARDILWIQQLVRRIPVTDHMLDYAVEIEAYELLARFPDPDGFLAGEIDVDTAAIPAMQHLDASARADLTGKIRAEMAEPLRSVTIGGHVQLPFQAHLARAER